MPERETEGRKALGKKKRWLVWPMGLAVGFLSGFFGAGGGMLGVPILRSLGLSTKESHATCIAAVAPLAAVSAYLYAKSGSFSPADALIYLPGGVLGALAGGLILPKLSA
ncbi:MAG: sulfite exporter TauE/SafE family protein, partial [Oscillospiraceae bacterium]|nr:sulfite exporter TauE/SafE family protein [Oscillospiraceae bacterium]